VREDCDCGKKNSKNIPKKCHEIYYVSCDLDTFLCVICTSSAQGAGKPLKASQAVTDSSYLAPTSGSLNLNVIHCQVAMHSHRVRLTGVAFTVTSVCIRHYLLDNFMSHQSNEHSAKQQAQEPQIKQEPRIKGKFFCSGHVHCHR